MTNFNQQRTYNNRGGQQNASQKKEPLRLNIEPLEFDGVMKSKLTTTISLAKTVNQLFRPVFTDYEGCIIAPDQFGQLQAALYFKDKGMNGRDNSIKTLVPVTERVQGTSPIDRIARMNLRNSNKSYDVSEDTKEILSEFIYSRGDKVNWSQHIVEQTERNYNGYSIYVKVIGIDLVRLVRKIYGGKIDGSRIDYNVSIVKPIGMSMVGGVNQNYLINIQQLDSKEVERLASEIGVVPVQGNIPMVR